MSFETGEYGRHQIEQELFIPEEPSAKSLSAIVCHLREVLLRESAFMSQPLGAV